MVVVGFFEGLRDLYKKAPMLDEIYNACNYIGALMHLVENFRQRSMT